MLLTSLIMTGLVLGVRQVGGLQALELAAFDWIVRLQPNANPDPRLLIVAISETDIQAQQSWPISDRSMLRLLQKLEAMEPAVVGLDIYRDVPQPPGTQELLSYLRQSDVVTITNIGTPEGGGVPAPRGVSETLVGFNDVVLDPDGVIRRNLLFASDQGKVLHSFSLRLALRYLALQGIEPASSARDRSVMRLRNRVFEPLSPTAGGYQDLDARGYQILMHYRSSTSIARQVTLTQVLQGEVDPDWVKGKVVLIGATARSTKDLFATPYRSASRPEHLTAGILIQAQMVSQILGAVLDDQRLIWFWGDGGEVLWILGWSLIGGVLAWRVYHPALLGVGEAIALSGLFGLCFLAYTQAGWIPLVPAAIALVVTSATVVTQRAVYSAFHDDLTGLPNRAMFSKLLQRAIARTHHQPDYLFIVLFLGLDRFKTINESLGHTVGDRLLVSIAQRLRACLRPGDRLARVGGDEFAILLEAVDDLSTAMQVTHQVQQELTQSFIVDEHEIFTTVSVGIAFNQSGYEHRPEELLRDAHTAMYRAKSLGKARHEIFAKGMRQQAVTRLQLETDLRRALERNEFHLRYQPFVCLKSGKIAGFEALLRWQHPHRGLVSPGEFIPVAEETGLIIPIGQWTLDQACNQICQWQSLFPQSPPLSVSVNLSGRQLSQPELVDHIQTVLTQTCLEPSSLKLEITESVVMDDVESTITLLQRLRGLHLQLSIDDFGTGYSSLSYLHRFPTNTLKIDRSFVSHMTDASENAEIARTIILLGHNLGMDIIAEGIETADQLAHLRALGCEYGQGYFFAPALVVEEAEDLLRRMPTW
ncbi:EAL domain-containing protein [Geitlerinema sp. PCC 7407]|uniref:EAL domain-containing protein n=1 Tax=Geitlerinema sp. PCC 7407 TaxID=1173025 RepID=UPI00029FF01E|nr:EAL domain-containing protein [Geitlerinema sp. PCC 7407]AFY67384.1 diguanylate cyclase/phosphodiesterase with Chase sensor [Geitlerinema sp. PCC 7407]